MILAYMSPFYIKNGGINAIIFFLVKFIVAGSGTSYNNSVTYAPSE